VADWLAREPGADLGHLAVGDAGGKLAYGLPQGRGGFALGQAKGLIEWMEACARVLHPVAPDPNAAEGGGHPAFLQALAGTDRGVGGDLIEGPQRLEVELLGCPPALRSHLLLEAEGLDPVIHRHPQLHHYTHLGREAHLLLTTSRVSLRALFVESSEPRAAVRGTHP